MTLTITNQNINQSESPYIARYTGATYVSAFHTLWLIYFLRKKMSEEKIADQKKWFKVWTTLLMDTHIPNNELGMFTRLGCAIAFRGLNGKLVTTKQSLHSILSIPAEKEIPQSFLDNFNVQIQLNGNDKITVTFKNWYKFQVDNSIERVAKHRQNVTRNVTIQDKIRLDKKKIRKEEDNISVKNPIYYHDIVDYLNLKAGTSFKPTTKTTQTLIKMRHKEGFTLEDFKTVIDKKVADWKNDPKYSEFLRPETLFGTKFEGYVNKPVKPKAWDE